MRPNSLSRQADFTTVFDASPSSARSGVVDRILATNLPTTVAAAIIGAAIVFIVGIPLATALNIWLDEAFTLHSTGAGIAYAWTQAIAFETQPPLYFVLEAAWRLLNEGSIAFARFPSVAFAALAVSVIVFAAHRMAPRVPPMVVAAATALNPLVVWAAVELRLYALVFLIGAVLTWTFFEAFVVPNASRSAQVVYTICAIVGLYTQYYVGFVLVAHGITVLAVSRAAIRPFAAAMAVVAVAFVPFAPIAMTHIAFSGAYVTRLTLTSVLHRMVDAVFVFVLPHELWWHGAAKLAGVSSAAALLASVFIIGAPVLKKPLQGVMLSWLACIVVFSALFSISGAPIDIVRHVIVIAPMSLLAALLLLSSVTRRPPVLSFAAIFIFAVFASTTLWSRYHPPLLKVGDWKHVADTLEKENAGAPIAVFPADLTLLLTTYQPKIDPRPIPAPMPFSLDYDRAMTLNDESAVARVLEPLRVRSAQLWIVTPGPCTEAHVDYDYHCRYLERYLHRRYRPVRSIAFPGALAELYIRRQSPAVPESAKDAN